MSIVGAFAEAFFVILEPANLLLLTLAVLLGMIMGVIPGLGGTVTIALLLPLTFGMDPLPAFLVLAACLGGVSQAGSLTSILINTPGRAGNAATVLDGYQMTRDGRAGEAIGASVTASGAGAVFGLLLIVLALPIIRELVFLFAPPDVFWVAIWGITTVAVVVKGSILTGIISALLGALLGLHGVTPITAAARWHYGILMLRDGIPLVALIIGLFAVSEMIRLVAEGGSISEEKQNVTRVTTGRVKGAKSVATHWWLWMRCSILGAIIGLIPGVGSAAANFIAYFHAASSEKNSEQFGTGDIRGVIAPESANDSKAGTSLIPTLGLGIPGSAAMAILLGAFVLHGITPGPIFFQQHLDVGAIIILGILFSNLASTVIGFSMANQLQKITQLDVRPIAAAVLCAGFMGVYAINNSVTQAFIPLAFGVMGYAMMKVGMSRVPLIIAFVLIRPIEDNFWRSLQISGDDYGIFVSTRLSQFLIILTLVSLFLPWIKWVFYKARGRV